MHPPTTLEAAGAAFWQQITEQHDLTSDPGRRMLLEKACRLLDLADRIDRDLRDSEDLMVRGSMGQPVPNGLLTEYRQYVAGFTATLRAMKLEQLSAALVDTVLPTRSAATRSGALRVVN